MGAGSRAAELQGEVQSFEARDPADDDDEGDDEEDEEEEGDTGAEVTPPLTPLRCCYVARPGESSSWCGLGKPHSRARLSA